MADLAGWGKDTSPFHSGEQELQARLGYKERQEAVGKRILRPYMPEQHREFYASLPFLIVGSVDGTGAPWASMIFGEAGFFSSPTERSVDIAATPLSGDPLAQNLSPGAPISVVGIELATRRRNRINMTVRDAGPSGLRADVDMSYGNCPQYIQTRSTSFVRDPKADFKAQKSTFQKIDAETAAFIKKADTFFVASHNNVHDQHDTGGVDVNHRGGQPGFVKVECNVLTIPDYMGNFAFNTLGNFMLNPKAGLMFVDFETGDILQMTGTTEILWDATPEVAAFRGAERAWRFTLEQGQILRGASPIRWAFGERSPNAKLTGTWDEAATILAAESKQDAWRPYRVVRVEDESATIRSFYLEPSDGNGLLDFKPGQFLTVRTHPAGTSAPLIRTYTVSSAPSDRHYRISVKRDGTVSDHLHSALRTGTEIEAKAPRGTFFLDTAETRPAILIAGGVGITPMMSMARNATTDGIRARHVRPLTVFHSTKTTVDRAFASEFQNLQTATNAAIRYFSIISQPGSDEQVNRDFHFAGHLTREILQGNLALDDYDVYICGPAGFMQSTYDIVRSFGIADARIFSESFGPSTLVRRADHGNVQPRPDTTQPEAENAIVVFSRAAFEQPWTSDSGTLLELAEAHGLSPTHGCRNGVCGTCAVKLRRGEVTYRSDPTVTPEADEVLICCAVPADGSEVVEIEL